MYFKKISSILRVAKDTLFCIYIPGCYFIFISKFPKTNGAFHSFTMIITIILFNVTSFSSNDTAQTRSETLANFVDEFFFHRSPWTINGRLQLLYTAVANFTSLALNMRPDAVVEGVQVRRLWRPEVFRPKAHVWSQPLLNNFCGVCRRTILLEYVVE